MKNGNKFGENELVFTGAVLVAKKGSETLTYDIVIKGDLDGNGMLNNTDYLAITKFLQKPSQPLTELKKRAADITEDGFLNNTDLLQIKKVKQGEIINY